LAIGVGYIICVDIDIYIAAYK